MSNLTAADKLYFERLFDMHGGYVLDFSNDRFRQFFENFKIDINSVRYQSNGTSKANRMRAFWNEESDALVGPVLSELLGYVEVLCESGDRELSPVLLEKGRKIVAKISGIAPDENLLTTEEYPKKEFEIPNIQDLPVDNDVAEIIQDRLKEAQKCQEMGAYLSFIVLCGSILEAVLIGARQKDQEKFNRSAKAPKAKGKIKEFRYWHLGDLIDVASDIKLLNTDVEEFSHGLRDFRNYIHPDKQLQAGFKPDKYTAKICLEVLKAALADVSSAR